MGQSREPRAVEVAERTNQMQAAEPRTFSNEAERKRVQAVVETLARTRQPGCSAAELAHDARNMVTALELYCDLLGEPGVLAAESGHYASELKLVASASRRLVEKLMLLEDGTGVGREFRAPAVAQTGAPGRRLNPPAELHSGEPIRDLGREIWANRNLLDAMAGISIAVAVRTEGGAHPVRMTAEDLTRVLVNLVKNASEAMRRAGRIDIVLSEREDRETGGVRLVLNVEDTGPGIREGLLEQVFMPGFTSRGQAENEGEGGWPAVHRGLGLSITRSIVEAAGGCIRAENREEGGARIIIELPAQRQ